VNENPIDTVQQLILFWRRRDLDLGIRVFVIDMIRGQIPSTGIGCKVITRGPKIEHNLLAAAVPEMVLSAPDSC